MKDIFNNFLNLFRFIMRKGGPGAYIYALFFKWYSMIILIAVVVLGNVLYALEKRGLLDRFFNFVHSILMDILNISIKCPEHIFNLQDLMKCLG